MKPGIWKVAHRGASGEAPENTTASFQRAIAQGADIIETDARLSKDKEIVLIHDETVERTTDGKGKVCELISMGRTYKHNGHPLPRRGK